MNLTDCNFPYIQYDASQSPFEWGKSHGLQFKDAIKELASIRRRLMLEKNPRLEKYIDGLSHEQVAATRDFSPELMQEMEGIAEGAGLPLEDIVILNNYTDFRDIQLPEEGCSSIHIQRHETSFAGQTWDMHKSAKNYLCIIHVPDTEYSKESLVLSLVGCVGLMGFNRDRCMIGVNNINTENARAALIWPALVRKVLRASDLDGMRNILSEAPVTSGHNYIISTPQGGEHWEITPNESQRVATAEYGHKKEAFHTNHCLGERIIPEEQKLALNSTTHVRYEIIEQKVCSLNSYEDLIHLFRDHENYPKSICSHYESGSQDPSFTCGAGVVDLNLGQSIFWRGCKEYDDNYREMSFELKNNKFQKIKK